MNLFDEAKVFKVKNRETGQEYDAVLIEKKLVKYALSIGDRPSFKEVERDIVDAKTKKVVDHVKDKAKCFDFDAGDHHGGMISAEPGDYLLREGDSYFVVPAKDKRSQKPIFDLRYVKV